MTTSDTLNRILKNEASFIDSILFDGGLDVFDMKLEGLKTYQKKINNIGRVNCDIERSTLQNTTLSQEIIVVDNEIKVLEGTTIPEVQNKITIGRKYVEDLTKKLFKIDPEIYGLNVVNVNNNISIHNKNILDLNARKLILNNSIKYHYT